MIRNKGSVALNVRFNYATARHYRLNPNTKMPSDPEGAYRGAPARVACGVPATGRANGRCYRNDGVSTPEPYSNGAKLSLESRNLGQRCQRLTNDAIINDCSGVALNIGARCGTSGQYTHYFAIPPGERIPRPSLNCSGNFASCGAPGVPQSYNGTYRCYINTGITPVPHPGPPPPPPPPPSLWGSISYGHLSRGYVWAIRYGRTESEARSSSLAFCRSGGSTDCASLEFQRGQCAALAHGTSTRPAFGIASHSTRIEAQNAAIAQCRIAGGTDCRIGTGDTGRAASACLTSSTSSNSLPSGRQWSGVF